MEGANPITLNPLSGAFESPIVLARKRWPLFNHGSGRSATRSCHAQRPRADEPGQRTGPHWFPGGFFEREVRELQQADDILRKA